MQWKQLREQCHIFGVNTDSSGSAYISTWSIIYSVEMNSLTFINTLSQHAANKDH